MMYLTSKEITGVKELTEMISREIGKLIVDGEVKSPEVMGAVENTRMELIKIQETLGKCYLDLKSVRTFPSNCEDGA